MLLLELSSVSSGQLSRSIHSSFFDQPLTSYLLHCQEANTCLLAEEGKNPPRPRMSLNHTQSYGEVAPERDPLAGPSKPWCWEYPPGSTVWVSVPLTRTGAGGPNGEVVHIRVRSRLLPCTWQATQPQMRKFTFLRFVGGSF